MGAEQLLSAAGHGDAAIHEAVDAIVRAAEATVATQRGPQQQPELRTSGASAPDLEVPVDEEPSAPEETVEPEDVVEEAGVDEDETTEARGSSEDEGTAPS